MALTRFGRERDSQRGKVYAAELAVWGKSVTPHFRTLDACREYMDLVMDSDYWIAQVGPECVGLEAGAGRRRPCFKPNRMAISLPRRYRNPWVIIHELAHALNRSGDDTSAPHGRQFCTHYLALVAELLGSDAAAALAAAFDEHGVRYDAGVLHISGMAA